MGPCLPAHAASAALVGTCFWAHFDPRIMRKSFAGATLVRSGTKLSAGLPGDDGAAPSHRDDARVRWTRGSGNDGAAVVRGATTERSYRRSGRTSARNRVAR